MSLLQVFPEIHGAETQESEIHWSAVFSLWNGKKQWPTLAKLHMTYELNNRRMIKLDWAYMSLKNEKPFPCAQSEMLRELHVLLSIDLTAEESSLSMYTNSGLFRESQVDIVSSKETEPLTDVLGEIFLHLGTIIALLEAGRLEILLLGAGIALMIGWSLLVENASLAITPIFTLKEAGKVFPESPLSWEWAEDSFFLAILAEHGTFKI